MVAPSRSPAPDIARGRRGRARSDLENAGAEAFDRSGEGRALKAMRTLLRRPPQVVEDDLPAQAWLEGLIVMADYVLRCHDTTPVAATPPHARGEIGRAHV